MNAPLTTNSAIAVAAGAALARLPEAVIGVGASTPEKWEAMQASLAVRGAAGHAAWAEIIRAIFDAAKSNNFALGYITELAGVLQFDPEGEEYGHYRDAPTAADVEAYISATTPTRAITHMKGICEFAGCYESKIPFADAVSNITSPEIVQAILTLAGGDEAVALQIWEGALPSKIDEHTRAVWEIVTGNGLRPSTDYYWGEEDNNWAANAGIKE